MNAEGNSEPPKLRRKAAKKIQGRRMTTVWNYVGTSKEVGDVDHLKAFASAEAAERWFAETIEVSRSNMRL